MRQRGRDVSATATTVEQPVAIYTRTGPAVAAADSAADVPNADYGRPM